MKAGLTPDNKFINPLFIGDVINNADPTFNYRVKVRIENLHPAEISDENLPWAGRVDTAFMGIGDSGDLNHAVPEVGSKVLLLAVGSDPNSLLYIGNLYKKTAQTPAEPAYLDTYGIYRPDGQFIGVDKIQKLFKVLFDGDIEIDIATNMNVNIKSEINITCKTANINTTDVNITTTNAKVDATDVQITTSTGKIECSGPLEVKAGVLNAEIQGPTTLAAKGNITITEGQVLIANAANQCFTALPKCIFTGIPHSTPQST